MPIFKFTDLTGFIPKTVSRDQAKDTGMAMVLVCLLIAVLADKDQFTSIAVVLLIVNMTAPGIYRPVAKIWLGFSHLLGTVMSKVILTILFVFLVTPVGLIRRLMGKDPMQIQKWKKGRDSVFRVRDHRFNADDIANPY